METEVVAVAWRDEQQAHVLLHWNAECHETVTLQLVLMTSQLDVMAALETDQMNPSFQVASSC